MKIIVYADTAKQLRDGLVEHLTFRLKETALPPPKELKGEARIRWDASYRTLSEIHDLLKNVVIEPTEAQGGFEPLRIRPKEPT